MRGFVFGIVMLFMGCAENQPIVKNQSTGRALGTTYSIIYLDEKELDLQKEIDSVFKVVNQSMSTYIPESDISKINGGDSLLVVDEMFREVFGLSKNVFEETHGYFDPTVGALVNAWGFGPGKQVVLDSSKVDSLLRYVGFDKVRLTETGTIKKLYPEIFFDFNAIAKGYTIDRLGVMLSSKGIGNYLVEVGGEVLTKGENLRSQKPWTVGIDDPQAEDGRQLKKVIFLKDNALASSGNYRKFRIDSITGQKYVHTIDTKTGFTKNSSVLAASVVTGNCALADAYATAFMAMDLDSSKDFLRMHPELEAYIIYLNQGGETEEYMTEGFKNLVTP